MGGSGGRAGADKSAGGKPAGGVAGAAGGVAGAAGGVAGRIGHAGGNVGGAGYTTNTARASGCPGCVPSTRIVFSNFRPNFL